VSHTSRPQEPLENFNNPALLWSACDDAGRPSARGDDLRQVGIDLHDPLCGLGLHAARGGSSRTRSRRARGVLHVPPIAAGRDSKTTTKRSPSRASSERERRRECAPIEGDASPAALTACAKDSCPMSPVTVANGVCARAIAWAPKRRKLEAVRIPRSRVCLRTGSPPRMGTGWIRERIRTQANPSAPEGKPANCAVALSSGSQAVLYEMGLATRASDPMHCLPSTCQVGMPPRARSLRSSSALERRHRAPSRASSEGRS